MSLKFRWVGLNKHFNEINIQENLTTKDLFSGNWQTFFSLNNRSETGNCRFLSEELFTGFVCSNGHELYDGDIIGQKCEIDGQLTDCFTVICFDNKNGQWAVDMSYSKDGSDLYPLSEELIENKCWKAGNKWQNADLLSVS